MSKGIAFFDFDGTITTKDTMFELIKFSKGPASFYAGMMFLSPILAAVKCKLLPAQAGKEKLLGYFFGGAPASSFAENCQAFCKEKLPGLLRDEALQQIAAHKRNGEEVVIVSASAEQWVKPWADKLELVLLSSRLEEPGGILTGKLEGPNCNGVEKVNRIRSTYDLNSYTHITCYGDTSGDLPMLSLATVSYFKPFRK